MFCLVKHDLDQRGDGLPGINLSLQVDDDGAHAAELQVIDTQPAQQAAKLIALRCAGVSVMPLDGPMAVEVEVHSGFSEEPPVFQLDS